MYHSMGSHILRAAGFWYGSHIKLGTGASLVFTHPFGLILLYFNPFLMPRKSTKKQPVAKAPVPAENQTSAPTLAAQCTCTGAQPVVSAVVETPHDLGPVRTDTAVTHLTPEVTDDVAILQGEYSACLSQCMLSHFLSSPPQLSSLP